MQFDLNSASFTVSPLTNHPGCKRGLGTIKASSLKPDLAAFTEVNPRTATRSGIYNDILTTLQTEPEAMELVSGGFTVIADSVSVDDSNVVHIKLTDKNLHGFVDGGHTLTACLEALKDGCNLKKADIPIRVFTGISKAEAVRMSRCQNTRTKVQPYSIADQDGYFDVIRSILGNERDPATVPGADAISYYEGCGGAIGIKEVIQTFNSLNPGLYSPTEWDTDKSQPQEYGRVGDSLLYYKLEHAKSPSSLQLLVKHLGLEILRLRDWVYKAVPRNWGVDGAKYGYLKINGKYTKDGSTPLYFIGTIRDGKTVPARTTHTVIYGMTAMMIAAYRTNVKLNPARGTCGWYHPIEQTFEDTIEDVVTTYRQIYTNAKESQLECSLFNATTKDKPLHFKACYDVVEQYLRMQGCPIPQRLPRQKKVRTTRRKLSTSELSR